MDWRLLLLISVVLIIVAYIELSYFSVNGKKVSLISKLILLLIFPIVLLIGFVLGSVFIIFIMCIFLILLVLAFVVYLISKFTGNKNDKIILIKRKK